MKTFVNILTIFFFAGAVLFTSCEREDKIYEGDEFVHFETEQLTQKESNPDTITVPVYLAGKLPKQDVNVSYTVTTSAEDSTANVDSTDYKIVEPKGGSFTFEAGTAVEHFKILVYDNIETDKNKMVTITLDNANSYVMGLPGSGVKKSFTLTIADDDCPFVAENFVGTPEGTDLGANSLVKFSLKESISEDKAVYEVTGLFMPMINSFGEEVLESNPVLFTLDNSNPSNPTVTLEGSAVDQTGMPLLYNTQGPGSTWQYYIYPTSSGDASTFSTCGKSVTAYYDIGLTENYSTDYGQPYWVGLKLDIFFTSKNSVKVEKIDASINLKSKMK